jgi:pSer/pThr/pTyr-binding forkhead associated (FHA) protein
MEGGFEIGIVCGRCESYSALGTTTCPSCENVLALDPGRLISASDAPVSKAPATMREPPPGGDVGGGNGSPVGAIATPAKDSLATTRGHEERGSTSSTRSKEKKQEQQEPVVPSRPEPLVAEDDESKNGSNPPVSRGGRSLSGAIAAVKSTKPKSVEELMDQAKNFVCRSCSTPVPMGHKFCGRCGAAVPPEILNARTQFFGQLQAPGKAKLILIRGEGVEGLSYQLNAEQHVVGKAGQLVFPDDPFVSPKHANFFYRNGTLCVKDEGSLNGVYLRVRGSVDIKGEDYFLAGEQVFRVDRAPKLNDTPGPDGTYFYSSPKHQSPFRITQVLQGGAHGMTVCARSSSLQIGREGGDLNFPTDLYMSASHCKIEDANNNLTLTDMSSRNGTYVRLTTERELAHGDYLFIGRKLLRVEITAA